MKKLFTIIAALALLAVSVLRAQADSVASAVTAGACSNLLSSPKLVSSITVTATTTNTTTFKFYDTSNTTTTRVQAAYSSYSSYNTNFSTIFTNEDGLLITNSFKGIYTYPTSVSASTSSLPAVVTIVIPASSQRTKSVRLQNVRGLAVVPDKDGIVEVDYQ
jgi:hypothetical protein